MVVMDRTVSLPPVAGRRPFGRAPVTRVSGNDGSGAASNVSPAVKTGTPERPNYPEANADEQT